MTCLLLILIVASLSLHAFAGSQSFNFSEPTGINKIVAFADASSFSGTATNVSGTVTFDPDQPAALKGRIMVESASVRNGSGPAASLALLDAAKFPQIIFETTAINNAKLLEDNTNTLIYMADVSGILSLRGVSKKVTVPVKICYIKDRLRERNPQLTGDLLRINANFTIQRSDFDPASSDKSANTLHVNFTISGQCPRQTEGVTR